MHTPERREVESDPSNVDSQEVFAFQKKLVHGCIVLQVDDDGVQDLTAQCTEGEDEGTVTGRESGRYGLQGVCFASLPKLKSEAS